MAGAVLGPMRDLKEAGAKIAALWGFIRAENILESYR
jgi:hypothetical protein